MNTITKDTAERNRLALAENIEFMLATGAGWGEILTRTGKTMPTLTRQLRRYGRKDLAHFFEKAQYSGRWTSWESHVRTCEECRK